MAPGSIEGSCLCGAVRWSFAGEPEFARTCNCTACRRYGVLWAYGFEGEEIEISGETRAHVRGDKTLGFHFCPECGCVAFWRAIELRDGRRRIAVNLRLAEPDEVAEIPVDHFDGFESFATLGQDGRCVRDHWF